jgi:hypothetical protein
MFGQYICLDAESDTLVTTAHGQPPPPLTCSCRLLQLPLSRLSAAGDAHVAAALKDAAGGGGARRGTAKVSNAGAGNAAAATVEARVAAECKAAN